MDLDPVPGIEWPQIVDVALVSRSVLADFGLTPAEVAERFGPAIITG